MFEITHFHSQALSDNFVNCPSSDEITYQLIIISVELNPFLNVLIVAEYQNVLKGVYFINILRSAIFKMWHKTLQLRQLCLAVAGLALLGLYVRWFLNCHKVQYCVEILCQCLKLCLIYLILSLTSNLFLSRWNSVGINCPITNQIVINEPQVFILHRQKWWW